LGEAERVAVQIEECGGLDKLEQLQHHENEQVYQKCSRILDDYFSAGVSIRSSNKILNCCEIEI
jgi:importin subunit alpha-2